MKQQTPQNVALSPAHRLFKSLCLRGHPKIPTLAAWVFFIPQFAIYLYLLGPVFVYYTQGVPPKESLEAITGTWRVEGKLGSNTNGLVAPHYFVDSATGPREVHCGFPMQRRLCDYGLTAGKRVNVHYDSYFGILAFENLDPPEKDKAWGRMSYEKGVFFYATREKTIKWNYHAHQMLALMLIMYGVNVYLCWRANGSKAMGQKRGRV